MGEPEFDKPLNRMTAPEVLEGEERFKNFVRALELSGVGDLLEKKGPYTIFAPDDDMFNINTIGAMTGAAGLEEILGQFIVPGKYTAADLRRLQLLRSMNGHPLIIIARDNIGVNGAVITRQDLPYEKGIIHEISNPRGDFPQ